MREIKFRAWVKSGSLKQHYNGMYDVYAIDIKEQRVIVKRASVFAPQDFNFDEIELLQYTGLKDKNGKEDYHKNILKNITTGLICTVEYGEYRGRTGVGYGWYLQKLDGELYVPYPSKLDDWENIGNIYENPKLLK